MKKHPVDDLFKGKLADLERQPSDSAWKRIEAKQKKSERRLAGWIWYAAAGVAVVLLSGYLVWQQQQLSGSDGIAVISGKADSLSNKVISPDSSKEGDLNVDQAVSGREISSIQKPSKVEERSDLPQRIAIAQKTQLPASKEVRQELVPPVDMPANEIAVNNIKTDLEPEPVKTNISQPMVALNENKEENRTIVVKVEVPEEDNEKHKTSRFTKVFRQLKNARAGDPVDWKDVGFNPKTIVARVDETIRDKEENISEKYQNIKQRTKL
ncbi:hypothetical protein [Dyadobacter psychrotolerans]|uniref:Uncharacterized protein n=1 Tax=Dyadobacter psychrotolerans TaxID=2541721 RepID=A0A4R5DK22_9BACT|nr:hypothetical protein [Dyadobacter psychrotolerans]TDE12350.1 hypothetical protein E0F88_21880 [Dyadobacter psychrotolerans]